MVGFCPLFNNQLLASVVFDGTFSSTSVEGLLSGIKSNAGKYGLDDNAAAIAERFLNDNPKTLKLTRADDVPVGGLNLRDLGAALGYLFSTQSPTTEPILVDGYRPILHVYGRLLQAVQPKWMMSCVVFTASDKPVFYYGATIPKPNTGDNAQDIMVKRAVKNSRKAQLQAALHACGRALPALTPFMVAEMARLLANVWVPEQTHGNPNQPRQPPLTHDQPGPRNALLELYEGAVRLLIKHADNSTGSIAITFEDKLVPYDTLVEAIGGMEQSKFRDAVKEALKPTPELKGWLEGKQWIGQDFGHCAETFPFIHILRSNANRPQSQGLAMKPDKMLKLDAAEMAAGTATYDKAGTFRRPCQNCAQVLQLAGMVPETYNHYIDKVVVNFDSSIK